jgi:hypothetical protein
LQQQLAACGLQLAAPATFSPDDELNQAFIASKAPQSLRGMPRVLPFFTI